jgi:hypothetical protein
VPFGFLGSAAGLVLVGLAIPALYAFVWPGGVARAAVFLAVTLATGAMAGLALFFWHALPLQGVGIAASHGASDENQAQFMAGLRTRFTWAAVGVVGIQVALCLVLSPALNRGSSSAL